MLSVSHAKSSSGNPYMLHNHDPPVAHAILYIHNALKLDTIIATIKLITRIGTQ